MVLIYTTNKFGEKFGEKFKPLKIGAQIIIGQIRHQREMKTQIKVTESLNGWSRLETTFVVESSPRWWQFWKPKVMHQEFNGSVWLKGEVVQSYAPVVETFKTK
jgi:hypothetical protein